MKDCFARLPSITTLAVLGLVFTGAAKGTCAPQAPGTAADSLTATIRYVDADAHTLAVLTGVGHALRLVAMEVEPRCDIKVDGVSAALRDLKPGQIVHIRYRKADGGKAAQAIETLPTGAEGGGR